MLNVVKVKVRIGPEKLAEINRNKYLFLEAIDWAKICQNKMRVAGLDMNSKILT